MLDRYKKSGPCYWLFWLTLAAIVVYRAFILVKFSIVHIDDDQALMWNGAAAFAHFQFPEPCFWGQSYGSMFESFLAVPLIWLHVPFQIALPLASTFLTTAPFVVVAILFYKTKRIGYSILCLIACLGFGWKWDILTSIPRSFLSGVLFSVAGSIMLTNQRKATAFFGAFLAMAGIVMTNTMAVIVSLGGLAYLKNIIENRKTVLWVLSGFLLGAVLYLYVKNFYIINADYSLHPNIPLRFSLDTLSKNIHQIPELIRDFSILDFTFFPILLTGTVIGLALWRKKWFFLLEITAIIIETVLLLSMEKTLQYNNDAVLFSQIRMFLYLPYAFILALYFGISDDKKKGTEKEKKIEGTMNRQKIQTVLLFVSVIAVIGNCCVKGVAVSREEGDPQSHLNNPYLTGLQENIGVLKEIEVIHQFAEENQADVIVTVGDNRSLSYAFDAIHYGKYTTYNIRYDRRTWNYHYLQHVHHHKCVFVDHDYGELHMQMIELEGQSVVNYLSENYQACRNPYTGD